ncbi:hypothetical protein ASPNIDRAFT_42118 [Aspergillus niger ATCC 1015]|uniref:Uncharacterized protein n=1 Tax=Aspergillus niger (strain ATCC 1015 / CBS 113.46 / FGSC A1144 / LSHB Ac4 / NCTC 3858a / NRRL 328 / USDA 3528.7) TaxID=380704 RepID=G3XWB9_ASPNA|nr:hypothetical protein ASPNIDRAFT_42118 [Aspergillus niger ATCC 1015]
MWPGPSMPLRMSSSRRSDPWKGHSWRPRRPNKTREKLLRIAAQFEPRYTCRSPHGNSRYYRRNRTSSERPNHWWCVPLTMNRQEKKREPKFTGIWCPWSPRRVPISCRATTVRSAPFPAGPNQNRGVGNSWAPPTPMG